MSVLKIQKISLIGAGNVAARLARALVKKGIPICQIYNRSVDHGLDLAKKTGAEYTGELETLKQHGGLFLICVSDQAVYQIADQLRLTKGLAVHTSGSLGMDVLSQISIRIGVFYPLQTFRKERMQDFRNIPVCIEASSEKDKHLLTWLAQQLTAQAVPLSSGQRRVLHLAAVFAGNFPNFMYSIAEEILEKHDIPFGLLEPLIRQTARNARTGDLFSQQTGPAIRDDRKVLEMHLGLLSHDPAFRKIYELISKSIIQYQRSHGKL
jgi:predicted short-subunit dehydrogenase-like oxidoreductase (DUF2520 family)